MEEHIVEEIFSCLYEMKAAAERIPVVPRGMGRAQMNILYSIYDLSRELSQVKITDISNRLGVKSSNVISNIKELEHQGYVEKASDTRDRRVVHVTLTKEGGRMVERYVLEYYRLLGSALEGSQEELLAMVSSLEGLMRQMRRTRAEFIEQLGGIEE